MIDRRSWSPSHPVVAALALGQIDCHSYNPWVPLERLLYSSITEFLVAWEATREPTAVATPRRFTGRLVTGARSS